MDVAVEISFYPLAEDYATRIKAFLERLRAAAGLKVITSSLSTQLVGPYDEVFATLAREMRAVFGEVDKAVFVLKVFGPLAPVGA